LFRKKSSIRFSLSKSRRDSPRRMGSGQCVAISFLHAGQAGWQPCAGPRRQISRSAPRRLYAIIIPAYERQLHLAKRGHVRRAGNSILAACIGLIFYISLSFCPLCRTLEILHDWAGGGVPLGWTCPKRSLGKTGQRTTSGHTCVIISCPQAGSDGPSGLTNTPSAYRYSAAGSPSFLFGPSQSPPAAVNPPPIVMRSTIRKPTAGRQ